MDPDYFVENPDIVYLTKSLAEICDNIPGKIVQNISGHTFKIMRDYMVKAGIFQAQRSEEE